MPVQAIVIRTSSAEPNLTHLVQIGFIHDLFVIR